MKGVHPECHSFPNHIKGNLLYLDCNQIFSCRLLCTKIKIFIRTIKTKLKIKELQIIKLPASEQLLKSELWKKMKPSFFVSKVQPQCSRFRNRINKAGLGEVIGRFRLKWSSLSGVWVRGAGSQQVWLKWPSRAGSEHGSEQLWLGWQSNLDPVWIWARWAMAPCYLAKMEAAKRIWWVIG